MNVLARDDASEMKAHSASRTSYCETLQDGHKIIDNSAKGKTCSATALASQSIVSNQDYAYYKTN